MVLKNFKNNPNQQIDNFFNLIFSNLGGFYNCVFKNNPDGEIKIGYTIDNGKYEIILAKKGGKIIQFFKDFKMEMEIPIPYSLSQNISLNFSDEFKINWNGISSNVLPMQPTAQTEQKAREISQELNSIPSIIDKIDIVPHRRGFFKPFYTPSAISWLPTTEDEVATIITKGCIPELYEDIINDSNLAPKISVDLEQIINRDFRLYTPPGTSMVYFKTTDKKIRLPMDLVNDGFGVNQLVYMLAKIHRPEIKVILIEEPEVHLHPTIIKNLVKTIISITKEEDKQFLIVTHSETFLSSLLTSIFQKLITPEEIKAYFVKKENKETIIIEQKVNEKGQIEGGLENFGATEIEDLKIFLGIKE
jgi:hypothetical protein